MHSYIVHLCCVLKLRLIMHISLNCKRIFRNSSNNEQVVVNIYCKNNNYRFCILEYNDIEVLR